MRVMPRGLGVTFVESTLPVAPTVSSGGNASLAQAGAIGSSTCSPIPYIVAGAVTTLVLGALVYFATR